ncbi:MAG: polymerase III subunit beta protein [candidate division WWE3 bacterium GW2011_GWB2_43_22]|uniref:Beta sliding clamp n=1 Tax=candidate division WWE3 bacterium GW2011_GWB2_43_22 TaxID=1619118 RepID=A0A0G1EMH6_UNCKA|nr:MAG: polymerase III subunit beta protein [candidate division WWE3 bacterium GW2011_GWB2_43_22]
MKFSCLQENLNKGLQIITRAVPAKGSLPILSNVLISTENGRLKLAATNLETAITTYVNASIDKEGAITVPAKVLKELVANLHPSTIEIKMDNDILHLKSDNTKSKLNGTDAKDYPELPSISKDETSLELDPTVFAQAVSMVTFASSMDESRPIFTGVYVTYEKGKMVLAATDGFRLSEKSITVGKSDAKKFTALIPAKTLAEVSKVFASSASPLKMVLSENENLALFSSEDTTIATRIIDGQYPDYKKIIPSTATVKATFNSGEFLEAVRLTTVFVKEGTNNTIKLRVDPEGLIKISSLNNETGTHESEIPAETEGEMLEIAFSSKYLLDFLNNVKGEKINMEASSNSTACIFKTDVTEDFLHIIMPIQL